MKIAKSLAVVATTGVLTLGMAAPASANHVTQSGTAGGLVAAVVNANVTDVKVNVVQVGDVNVALTNVLNRNRVLTDFLNQNEVTVTDVVDVTIVDNVLVIDVL